MNLRTSVCADRKDYKSLATKLGKEAKVEARFVTLLKGNFKVQFERGKTVGVERAIQTVHSYLEQAHRDLAVKLGGRTVRRISVVIYNSGQYKKVRSAHGWARAYYDGKLRIALKNWPAGRTELRRDLRHELTHAFLHELYPKTRLWLHEGLAQRVEGRSALGAAGKFRSGGYKLLPVETFTGRFANSKSMSVVNRGYAQSLMLVGYLEKIGTRRKLQTLLAEISRGTGQDQAVRLIYRKGIADLLAAATK